MIFLLLQNFTNVDEFLKCREWGHVAYLYLSIRS